ncbi:MAG TPA: glycosyltransferase family 4 protein [Anaerolineales bacterium]|nr:glycosyltransferase family 4 protein [Anaerolineales bacterium]
MKLLFLLTQDLESPSGLGRYWPLARALAGRGHEVRIAALHSMWDTLQQKHFVRDGVTIDYVAPMHVIKYSNQKMYYPPMKLLGVSLAATLALSRAAFSSKVDIIHIGKPHPMNSIAGWLAMRVKRIPMGVDCDDYEASSNRFSGRWQQEVVEYFEKRVPRSAGFVTTNTHYMQSMLLSWGCPVERIFYIPNGVERERFKPPKPDEINQLRTNLGLNGKRVVLYAGSLSLSSHPVELLLRAFALLYPNYPDTVLLLVGGGEDYQNLKDQTRSLGIHQATFFAGRVDPDQMPGYYHLAEVSVDPVKDDEAARGRSPLKLFESWACGVPFVSGEVGDRPYLVGTPPAGLLVKHAGDAQALADGICQILDNPDLAQELRERGLERVANYFWDYLAEKMEHVYQLTLSG